MKDIKQSKSQEDEDYVDSELISPFTKEQKEHLKKNQTPSLFKRVSPALRFVTLLIISILAIISRIFSVIRYESVIHEFDPWFNFRSTQFLVQNGIYKFW